MDIPNRSEVREHFTHVIRTEYRNFVRSDISVHHLAYFEPAQNGSPALLGLEEAIAEFIVDENLLASWMKMNEDFGGEFVRLPEKPLQLTFKFRHGRTKYSVAKVTGLTGCRCMRDHSPMINDGYNRYHCPVCLEMYDY